MRDRGHPRDDDARGGGDDDKDDYYYYYDDDDASSDGPDDQRRLPPPKATARRGCGLRINSVGAGYGGRSGRTTIHAAEGGGGPPVHLKPVG